MSNRMRNWRTLRKTIVAVMAAAAGLTLAAAAYRSSRGFERAQALFQAGQLEEALAEIDSWPGLRLRGESTCNAAYALAAKIALAMHDPVLACAWLDQIPPETSEVTDPVIEAALKAITQGRLKDAEIVLNHMISLRGRASGKVASQLAELYWLQCRFEEAEPLYARMFDGSLPTLAILQNAMANDPRALRPERQRVSLEKLETANPADDRVQLGLARLDLLTGDPDAARRRLDSMRVRTDRPYWLARRDLAIATRDLDELVRSLDAIGVPGDDIAWTARLHAVAERLPDRETRARFAAFASDQGTPADLELAAEFAAAAAEPETAKKLRDLKRQRDEAFETYRRALQNLTTVRERSRIEELARLAGQAGRKLDAEALRLLASEPDRLAITMASHLFAKMAESPAPTATGSRSNPAGWEIGWKQLRAEAGKPPDSNVANQAKGRNSRSGPDPVFEDVTKASGIDFVYESGKSVIRQLPETMGGGVAILDFDADGHPDIYAVQGGPFGNAEASGRPGDRLFRNRGDGTFDDVTQKAGLPAKSPGYAFGVTTGDFDNDGHTDLFVTRWRGVALLRNRGDGTFHDITAEAGLAEGWHWPTSAAFADLDADGDLDLYVCQYLDWNERDPRICRDGPAGRYVACDPLLLEALPDRVFRNEGGRFVQFEAFGGRNDPPGRGLGVVAADFDGDRRIDLFVANDKSANKFYLNRGLDGFDECALTAGVAANSEGGFQAGMGTDAGDIDGDGLPDLVVTNFFGEGTSAFRNLGAGQFAEMGKPWGITAPSRFLLGFGVALADIDSDGLLDYVSVNGHVNDLPDIRQAMPMQVLLGQPDGGFRKPLSRPGEPLAATSIGRALAVGDLDSDGRVDLVAASLDGPLRILKNVTPLGTFDHVAVRLAGRKSNRDGIGARLRFMTSNGRSFVRFRTGGGSYQSASDTRIHAAVQADRIVKVQVEWPSGTITETDVKPERANRTIVIEEQ